MYELTIKGFKNKEQAEAFITWYEGSGEQDASYWFECRQDEGKLDVGFMPVDVHKPYEWCGNSLVAHLDIDG